MTLFVSRRNNTTKLSIYILIFTHFIKPNYLYTNVELTCNTLYTKQQYSVHVLVSVLGCILVVFRTIFMKFGHNILEFNINKMATSKNLKFGNTAVPEACKVLLSIFASE